MARTSTTWTKGQGGKPRGAKDEVPRSFKATLLSVFERVCSDDPAIIGEALERGLRSRRPKDAFPYLKLYAELRGELKHIVQINDVPAFRVVLDDDGD